MCGGVVPVLMLKVSRIKSKFVTASMRVTENTKVLTDTNDGVDYL